MNSPLSLNARPSAADGPRLLSSLRDVCRGSRAGWSPRNVLIAFVAVLPAYLFHEHWLRGVGVGLGVGFWLGSAVGAVALACLFVSAFGAIAGAAGWEYGRNCRWTLRESTGCLRQRAGNLCLSFLATPLVVGFLVTFVGAGAWALGLLWGPLQIAWLIAVGFPCALIAAIFLFLGVPATLLMIPAAALDCRECFETVSRSISYVRTRPFEFALYVFIGIVSSLVAALVFTAFWIAIYAFLTGAYGIDDGSTGAYLVRFFEIPGETLVDSVKGLAKRGGFAWPFWEGGYTEGGWLPIFARLIPASLLAALFACMSRVYLVLRWAIDRDPPSALVHVNESFEWAD